MPPKRAFLAELPGDPLSDYLKATLTLSPILEDADAFALPALTAATLERLLAALSAGKPAYLPNEALPETLSPALAEGLSALTRRGLILCPLTDLPRWAQTGTTCPDLLTLERLQTLAGQGFDRIYLAARPGATPLAAQTAKRQNIRLTGGTFHGAGKSHRFGVVHPEK